MILQVGVKICLLNRKNQILLAKRSEKYGKIAGQWDIIGGRIDPGTSLVNNLKREIEEETGIKYKGNPKFIYAQDIIGADRHVVRLTYMDKINDYSIKKNDSEWTEVKWFSVDGLKGLKGLGKYIKEVLPLVFPSD